MQVNELILTKIQKLIEKDLSNIKFDKPTLDEELSKSSFVLFGEIALPENVLTAQKDSEKITSISKKLSFTPWFTQIQMV